MSVCVQRIRPSKRTEFDGMKMIRGTPSKRRKISNGRYQGVYVHPQITQKNTHENLYENAKGTPRWTTPQKRIKSMEVDSESSALQWRSLLSPKAKAFIGITDSENGNETVSEPSMNFKLAIGSKDKSRTASKSDLETNRGFLGFKQWIPLQEDDDNDETVSV